MARSSKTETARENRLRNEEQVFGYLAEVAEGLDQRNQISRSRGATTAMARDQIFRTHLESALSAIFKNKISSTPYVPRRRRAIVSRTVNLLLSDLHFGANLDGREVPFAYGATEEARRLAAVVAQTAEYKRQHRDETVLNVHLAGDIIQGTLHDARDGVPLAQQSATAIYLLTQALAYLASQYRQVNVRATPGNHGRFTSRHKERAVHQKWDALETVIYFAVKNALAGVKNLSFEMGYRPFYTYDSYGQAGMVTHGDTVIKPGFPGSNIAVSDLRKQVNEYNASQVPIGLVAVGHVHTASVIHLPNRCVLVTNGALVPPDSHGVSIGIHESTCGQQLWEAVPGYILGDHRFLVVDEYTDRDKGLEKIIKPFQAF